MVKGVLEICGSAWDGACWAALEMTTTGGRFVIPDLRSGEPSPVLCALPLLEGWRDVDQVRREHQGQGGTTGPRAPRRLRLGVGGDEGDLGPAGDEPGDAAHVGAPDRDRRR